TVASGAIEKTLPLFWLRIAPICPLTSMAVEKGKPKYNTASAGGKRILAKSGRLVSRKFSVNQALQIFTDRGLIEALDHFIQEAGDDELLRRLCRNATRTKIEHFVFIDLA